MHALAQANYFLTDIKHALEVELNLLIWINLSEPLFLDGVWSWFGRRSKIRAACQLTALTLRNPNWYGKTLLMMSQLRARLNDERSLVFTNLHLSYEYGTTLIGSRQPGSADVFLSRKASANC